MFTSTPYPQEGGGGAGIGIRQSTPRGVGRQSYAFPPQQVFEDTRSMLTSDRRSMFEQEPELSVFENTTQNRSHRRLTLSAFDGDDLIGAMEALHHAFGFTIQRMTDRADIFQIVQEWMEDLELAMQHRKNSETDLSDANVRKLHNLLQKEHETWNLIYYMFYERLNEGDSMADVPFTDSIVDRFRINEEPYMESIFKGDPSLKEMNNIMKWLEINFKKNGAPDLNEKDFIWENTLESIRRDKLLEKPTSKSMVTHVDPDAPTREGKQLHPLDDEENTKVLRGAYYYVRTGDPENAISYLFKSGEKIKASALTGYRHTCVYKIDPETGENVPLGTNIGERMGNPESEPITEYAPNSRRQARPNPDYEIIGNPTRDLWKNITWKICESKKMSKYDRAVMGALCGHREAMLDVCHTWEDKLWAFLRASSDTILETRLRNASVPNVRKDLPDAYWSQALSISECIDKVDAITTPEPPNSCERLMLTIQKSVMVDKMEDFITLLQEAMPEMLEVYDHPLLNGHLVRFLSHLLLFLSIVELPYKQELIDICIEKYVTVLVDIHRFQEIPFYVQKLSENRQIPNVVRHVRSNRIMSREEIELFLQAAHNNDLDILGIGIAVVEKMRDEQDDFVVDNLNWISCCYNIVADSHTVMYEYLKYTIWIARKYLTLGKVEKVQKLIGQLSPENVGEVTQVSPLLLNTLIREYACYRVYLEAEDSFNLWKTALSQRPYIDKIELPRNATMADKTVFEKKKKEQELIEMKWKQAVKFHLDNAIVKFLNILNFPSGWLRDCYDPTDEDETIHVGAVRRIVLRKVIHVLLRLVRDKNDNRTMRDFVYVLCDDHRNILCELSPSEIGNIFKIVEEFTRNKVDDVMFLPK
ncbi:unnamed protein product [Orchesella dallaii]|uniref:Nuclear pore complex protein n=1 Tax=Orchesella dallaii TaxID=48710 RepID=A0ABP1PZD3_9HEXA